MKLISGSSPIHDAFPANFPEFPQRPSLTHSAHWEPWKDMGALHASVCLVKEGLVDIYMENGDNFTAPIPFAIKKCWPSR